MYNVMYNNNSSCSRVYSNSNTPGYNTTGCNLNGYCNSDDPVENNNVPVNLNIIDDFSLNYIINNNLFKV